jgi:hypothetical protein
MQRSIALRSLLGGAVLIAVLAVSGCVYYDPYDPYYAPNGYDEGYRDGYYHNPPRDPDYRGDYYRNDYNRDRYYRGY